MKHTSFPRLALVAAWFLGGPLVAGCDLGKVCEPNQLQCSPLKNRIEQCNADGTAVETVGQCPGNTCVERGGTAVCEGATEKVCTANETRCDPARPGIVEQCKTTGDGWFVGTTCPGQLTCVVAGDVAQCQQCAPGSTRCGANNASFEVCDATGMRFESGGSCDRGSCKLIGDAYGCEFPCTPGETRCGLANQTVQTCNATGDAYVTSFACPNNGCRTGNDGAYCQCTPGTVRCGENNSSVETCNNAGTGFTTTAACGANSCKASGDSFACEFPCTPGATRCGAGNGFVETCNTNGNAYTNSETCLSSSCRVGDDGAYCLHPTECSPGERRCSATRPSVVEQCRTTADGWFDGTTCSGTLVCTTATGNAACQVCVPGSTRCGANNGSLEICNAEGTGYGPGPACANNSCKSIGGVFACEFPCTPGATRCGSGNAFVETCNANGNAYTSSESCLWSSCRVGDEGAFCFHPTVCSPGTRRCSTTNPGVVEQCRTTADGWFNQSACGGALTCTTASGTAACQTCVPGVTRCGANNATVEVCNATGTGFTATATCTNNTCKLIGGVSACEFPCTPGDTRCGSLNQNVQVCNAAGTAYDVAERCLVNSCTTELGSATCRQPEVCVAGTRRCSASVPNQVEQCRTTSDGWYTYTACAGALTCIGSGTCQSCVPGSRICGANNASVQVCNQAGTGYVAAETCSSNSCQTANGVTACEFPCVPGTTRCAWNRARIEICDASGTAYVAGDTCLNSSCGLVNGTPTCNQVPVCTAGTRRCSATRPGVIERCRTTSDGWYDETACGGSLLCTTESGSAACQACVPGSKRCGASNGSVEVCNAAGTAFSADETCANGSCKLINGVSACEFPCTPGQTRCGSLNSQVQACSADGSAYVLAEACLWNSCTSSGGAAWCMHPRVCNPGERRCSTAAANIVEQCKTTGDAWFNWTTCGGALRCTVTATGTEGCQTCLPGTRACGANNASITECNATGTGFFTAESCLDNSCRTQNGNVSCDFPCQPGALRCGPLRNRVDACNSDGTGVETVETCAGNTCVEALGSAFCNNPPAECVSGESRCSPLGTQVQECSADGRFVAVGTCSSADCTVINGVAQCAAPVCQPNIRFCADDGNVHYCNSSGKDGGIQRTCGVNDTCMVLDGAAQCVAPELAMSCEPNIQFCGDDGVIYYCNSQGQVSGIRSVCGEDQVCVLDASAPMCLDGYYDVGPNGETICVVTATSACVTIPKAFTTRGYVYAETEKTSCDNEGRITRECGDRMECLDGRCTSSVLDEDSPWYAYSCPLVQHLAYRTSLEADCRCFTNNSPVSGVPICGRPYDRATAGVRVGTGPRVVGLANAHIMGGFVDGNELIVAVYWGSSTAQRGAILAIHVDSGDRRLVSGDLDSVTAGSGPALSYALDVRKGADGNYYAFTQSTSPGAPSIYRIVPATGARTLVWRGQDASFGQCAAGDPNATASVQYTNNGFAVEANGSFLVGYANPIRDGRGIVRIAANGSSCTYVTATGARADGLTRGTGPDLGGFVQGFMIDGTKVIVHTTQPKALVEVDLVSGNRTVLVSSGIAGTIGERWAVKDTARGVIWTAGLMNSVTLVAYDRTRNLLMNAFAHCSTVEFPWYPLCPGAGPVKINSLNYGGIWLHPHNGNLLMAQDSISIIEFEPATANSVIRSL